jgi:uncharacterized membrane protein YfcA
VIVLAALGLAVGVVIGGLGGGGGVLTVPVLVYVVGLSAQDATTGSVVIVGVTALAGVLGRVGSGAVRWRSGLALGAVGVPWAVLGTVVNQRVPEPVLLLSFAALTLAVAVAMLVDARDPAPTAPPPAGPEAGPRARARVGHETPTRGATAVRTVLCGIVIGFLTGFLGVGGGFLIVPALLFVLRLPMATAVGTSLFVTALNSAAALTARAGVAQFDWPVLVPFTVAAVAGGVLGRMIADRLTGPTLSRAFAVLLLGVGGSVGIASLVGLLAAGG